MPSDAALAAGRAALTEARWADARAAFEATLREHEVAEALAGLAEALHWLGDVRQSNAYRARAYAAYRRAGDVPGAVESAVWLCASYAMVFGNRLAAHGWLTRAERVLEAADDETGPLPDWVALFRTLELTDLRAARDVLESTLASARTWGDLDLEVWSLSDLGVVLVQLGDVGAGLRCVDESMAAALSGEGVQFDTTVHASCSMLTVCDLLADLDRATQWRRAADEFTAAFGGQFLFAYCRVTYGRVLMATGHWDEAEAELAEALASTRDLFPPMHARALTSLAELRLRQGRLEEADAMLADVDDPVSSALVAAELALRRGAPTLAVRLVERWLAAGGGDPWASLHPRAELPPEGPAALGLLVEAHLANGDGDAAAGAADRLAAHAAAYGGALAAAHLALARGRTSATSGAALPAAGRSATAAPDPAQLEQAVERFAGLGLPLETARARLWLARATEGRQHDAAVAEARAALASFDRLGATADADEAAALLRSWGAGGRTGPRNVGLLTRREREVLGLLADGLSNREIAERLVISAKTVAHHVSNVLAKLQLRNRTEVAAYAARTRGAD
jgi:ATP/maltotriose-dependent transcriptional regulator MalT